VLSPKYKGRCSGRSEERRGGVWALSFRGFKATVHLEEAVFPGMGSVRHILYKHKRVKYASCAVIAFSNYPER